MFNVESYLNQNTKVLSNYNSFVQSDLAKAIKENDIRYDVLASALSDNSECPHLTFTILEYCFKNAKFDVYNYTGNYAHMTRFLSLSVDEVYSYIELLDTPLHETSFYKLVKMTPDLFEQYYHEDYQIMLQRLVQTNNTRLFSILMPIYMYQAVHEGDSRLLDFAMVCSDTDAYYQQSKEVAYKFLKKTVWKSKSLKKLYSAYPENFVETFGKSNILFCAQEELYGKVFLPPFTLNPKNQSEQHSSLGGFLSMMTEILYVNGDDLAKFLDIANINGNILANALFGDVLNSNLCDVSKNIDVYLSLALDNGNVSRALSRGIVQELTKILIDCNRMKDYYVIDSYGGIPQYYLVALSTILGVCENHDAIACALQNIYQNKIVRTLLKDEEKLLRTIMSSISFACINKDIDKNFVAYLFISIFGETPEWVKDTIALGFRGFNRLMISNTEDYTSFVKQIEMVNGTRTLVQKQIIDILKPADYARLIVKSFNDDVYSNNPLRNKFWCSYVEKLNADDFNSVFHTIFNEESSSWNTHRFSRFGEYFIEFMEKNKNLTQEQISEYTEIVYNYTII